MYTVIVKDTTDSPSGQMPFYANPVQRKFIHDMHTRNITLKARQLGMCLDPDTRVLTTDLRWVKIKDVKAGMKLVACDEFPLEGRRKGRKMRVSEVVASKTMTAKKFRITFDDGREVVCTDRHPWLSLPCGKTGLIKWRSLCGEGNQVKGTLKIGAKVRWITKPWDEGDYEDGWFGGMLDGEGSISKRNVGAGVNVSQREGPTWQRVLKYARDRGYHACIENDQAERLTKYGKVPVPKLAFGRMDEMFRLIGQTRPTRFINNLFWEGRELPGKRTGIGWATIVKIEALGSGEVVDLQTTTGTYIAEGFVSHNTTIVCMAWLDYALFNQNAKCGIAAQDDPSATAFFRDKVKFAYDNLDPFLKEMFPLESDNANMLRFAHNNSSIRVATSFASATLHRLLISEYAKICAKNPARAQELKLGTLPTVPSNGIVVIESTGEGPSGDFYDKVKVAERRTTALTELDYRLHFYPWYDTEEYTTDPTFVTISPEITEYLARKEQELGITLTAGQKAWYFKTLEGNFSGDQIVMFSQYPTTPDEPFFESSEGVYFKIQMQRVRAERRICNVPIEDEPVNTFWDIGRADGTAIWFHQKVGLEHRFIDYYEVKGQTLKDIVGELKERGYVYGVHYLPHDAAHKRLSDDNESIEEMLMRLMPGHDFEVLARVTSLIQGIEITRQQFASAWFDATRCEQGIARLDTYTKKFSSRENRWLDDEPFKGNGASEAADAFRQWAQAKANGDLREGGRAASGGSYNLPPPPLWQCA
jgi:hypothetical protein